MILLDKDYDLIMKETLAELKGMGISEDKAGSVARLFLSIINKQLSHYYKALKTNHIQAFVSKAKGEFLDLIGVIVDCKRNSGEEDDDFRYRITKQIQIVASANRTAIRLAALSVPGVQDVMLKRFTHGTGSFSVYVISEEPYTPQELLDQVYLAIQDTEAFGIRSQVFRPIILPVDIRVRLIFNKAVSDLERNLALAQSQDALRYFINSRPVGALLRINDIKKVIKDIHSGIEDIIIFDYKIKNRPVLPVDQECAWNERFIESDKPNAIQVI